MPKTQSQIDEILQWISDLTKQYHDGFHSKKEAEERIKKLIDQLLED